MKLIFPINFKKVTQAEFKKMYPVVGLGKLEKDTEINIQTMPGIQIEKIVVEI